MACCRPTGLQSLALLALGEDVHRHGAQEHKTLDRLHHCGVDAHDRQALVDDAHDQCADNGAGKSTLVHVLAGLEQPDAGSIAAKMSGLRKVGVPYTDEEIAGAAKALEGKTEMDALIAYLQGLGRELKVTR